MNYSVRVRFTCTGMKFTCTVMKFTKKFVNIKNIIIFVQKNL